MQLPVQKREQAAPRLGIVIVLGCLVAGFVLTAAYSWLGSFLESAIIERGGAPEPGMPAFAKLDRVVREAWPRERAARAQAPELPLLTFDLKRRDIGKLAVKRAEALTTGFLVQEAGDYVDADVQVNDGEQESKVVAKIRLKGDFTDHIKGDKWSFRVKTRRGEQILGMRVFSLQHPKVRGYAHECLILEHMRREGVLAPRYRFVRVRVNGRDKGIMALEEHFSKELLESQRRRESVIVRFDETLKWRTVVLMGQLIDFSAPYPLVTAFQSGKVAASPALQRDHEQAVALLRGLLSKDLAPSQVFDPDLTARFLAVAEIWGAEHALAWNNMRFYYNPITGLLEPIAFDCNLQDAAFRFIPTALVSVHRLADNITADWLEDPAIRAPFLHHLGRLSRALVEESAWEPIRAREVELQRILHQEFPLIPDIAFGFYRMRAERLAMVDADNFRTLPLESPNYPVLLHAFLQPGPTGFRLELYNLVPYPLEVTGVTFAPAAVTADRKFPILLPPTPGLQPPEPVRIELSSREDITSVSASVTAVIPGYPHTRSTLAARRYSATATAPVLPAVTWEAMLALHGGYVRRDGDTARIGPGAVRIDRPLLLPPGAGLAVAPGTRITFGSNTLVIVHGPVQMAGTAAAPIELGPVRGGWRGIAVLRAQAPSVWTHVRIRGTRGLRLGRWEPTGSVMFYESEARLHDCELADNTAEDMLNLVRSKFVLENITVERCRSDAIDTDFCEGTLRGGTIRNIGGDGFDVSGTTADVHGTRFERIKDKAVSAGEGSTLQVKDIDARDCGTGIASKDASRVEVTDASFTDMRFIALIAYMKKPEYGTGHITAARIGFAGTGARHAAQIGSSIRVDGRVIPPEELDVDALYTVGPMQKQVPAPARRTDGK